VSNTDFVNSGSYFFTDRVVVFGITTFTGLGGSFFNIGLIKGFTDTKDFAVGSCFLTGACSFAAGFEAFASGFFETTFATGFTDPFLGADFLDNAFLRAGLAGFPALCGADFAIAFFTDAFPPVGRAGFAGLALPAAWAGFLVADFPDLCGAGFLVGMLLPFF
jgi:hypothetical protein